MSKQNNPRSSLKNKRQEKQKSIPVQEEKKSVSIQEEKKTSVPTQGEQKSVPVPEKRVNIGKVVPIVVTIITICTGVAACIAAFLVVPEFRTFIGLKNEPNKIEVVIPTESISPTPTNGPCLDILDVRFLSAPIFSKESLSDTYITPPNGEFMIIPTEYKNLQTQPVDFKWDKAFQVAGQLDTASNDFTYYAPNWSVTWDYADQNNLGGNCSENLNPGIWTSCYMVFDIDPAIENPYLILYNLQTEDGKPFNNACKTSWKIPVDQ